MLALLRLKRSFGDPAELSSWDAARAADCCTSWRGVGCGPGPDRRVTSVGVFYANASGRIPSFISALTALTVINFFNLPNVVGPLPPTLATLPALTQLTVSGTAVSGRLPRFLCNMTKLSYLDLSGNMFSGSILPCLKFLPALSLRSNQLVGRVPASFAGASFLNIDLSLNQLTGNPSFLLGAGKEEINLSWNQFDFDLTPAKFSQSLQQIDLNHNKIRGRIPQQIRSLKMLTLLDVSYNELCGPIPEMKQFSELPLLFEYNKCLCGTPLPPCRR